METLANVYHAMATIGGAIFILSYILGWDHALLGDIGHLGHGLGDFLHAHGADVPHGDHHGAAAVNPINFRNMLSAVAAFGIAGTIALASGMSVGLSIALSIVIALMLTAFVWWFTIFTFSQATSGHTTETDFVSAPGQVTISIPEAGLGEVTAVINGQYRNLPARSFDGKPIERGAQIATVAYEEGVVAVVPLE